MNYCVECMGQSTIPQFFKLMSTLKKLLNQLLATQDHCHHHHPHHHQQQQQQVLALSACCNRLSPFNPMTSFEVFLWSLPFHEIVSVDPFHSSRDVASVSFPIRVYCAFFFFSSKPPSLLA